MPRLQTRVTQVRQPATASACRAPRRIYKHYAALPRRMPIDPSVAEARIAVVRVEPEPFGETVDAAEPAGPAHHRRPVRAERALCAVELDHTALVGTATDLPRTSHHELGIVAFEVFFR